jgi:hypothetical protein
MTSIKICFVFHFTNEKEFLIYEGRITKDEGRLTINEGHLTKDD